MAKKTEITLTNLTKHTCPSLSGKSTLKYQIGTDDKGEPWLQVTGNTGGGFFNAEPVSLTAIAEMLAKLSPNTPISSLYFGSLFRGSSSNSSGFLLAALRDQGIVEKVEGMARKHQLTSGYLEKIQALSGKVVSKPKAKTATPRVAKKKAARKSRNLLNAAS
jgi:hypothetical protein